MSLAGGMCVALARACGGTPAWALALLREHRREFDAFWREAFLPPGAAIPPGAGDAGGFGAGDIDGILGRT